MSTGRNAPPLGATGDMDLPAPVHAQQVSRSTAIDWLAHMILAVKTVAAGAEFIPLPYIRAAFSTAVIFLETVDKMKKNRNDLRELCERTVEIVFLLQDEISAHGHVVGARFMGLCENFMSFLRLVQTGLENLMRNRNGLRGRFKEFLRATTVVDQIECYRIRVNELRSNCILAATIQTNFNVASIQRSVSAIQEIAPSAHQFRRVALGDINLLYETAMSSKVDKIKVFTARISGEPSLMTVAKYEGDNERWKVDLEQHSRWRHPHVSQLFGISSMPGIQALIYYDELIPLRIYRQFHRPSSDLVWGCIEGMLFKQFKESSQHHYWSTGDKKDRSLPATICVKRDPVRLCLAMPGLENGSAVPDLEHNLSSWHTAYFGHQKPAPETFTTISNILTATSVPTLKTLASHIDWTHCLSALLPVRYCERAPREMQTKLFLGSVVTEMGESEDLVPVAYIPNSGRIRIEDWVQKQCPDVIIHPEGDGFQKRFTFSTGSFAASEISRSLCLDCSIELEGVDQHLVSMSWLSQANHCIGGTISKGGKRYRYGTIDTLRCLIALDTELQHMLRPEGTLREAHLFPCSISVRHQGPRIGLDFPDADHWYWSLDPTGITRMTQDECDLIGLPRWKFDFVPTINAWHEYHYNAIREFSETRDFDPYSNDATRLLGLSLAEIESNIPTNATYETSSHSRINGDPLLQSPE
ncbi:hypothetical protein DFH09DRAFT_1357794 [Mycena vulgaris]|nr:hypothetical protein DFH09DRAFT_1357794 [Mycena vulgaris]